MFSILSVFSGPYALIARWVTLALACAALFGYGYVKGHHSAELDFERYKGGVESLAKQAEARTATRIQSDKLNKETADADHTKAIARLAADNRRLLNARANSNILPASTAPAGSVEAGSIKFNREQLERAIQQLDAGVSGLIEKGDEARLSLNIARQWALRMTTELR
jgi:hypothetical protein